MDIKEFKNGLKELVAKFTTQKFEEVKTADGKTMSCPKMEVGQPCMMDGQPAPDGEYKLENGMTCTVKEGKIIDLKPNDPAANQNQSQDMTSEQINELISKIVDQKMAAMTESFNKQFGELKSAFEGLSKTSTEQMEAKDKEMADVKEKFEKEMQFSKEVMTLLEKIPDGDVKKPADKKHKKSADPMEEIREWREKHLGV